MICDDETLVHDCNSTITGITGFKALTPSSFELSGFSGLSSNGYIEIYVNASVFTVMPPNSQVKVQIKGTSNGIQSILAQATVSNVY